MLTLHIEAETFKELHAKAIAALYHDIPQPEGECGVTDDEPAPPIPVAPKEPKARKPKVVPVPAPEAPRHGTALQAQFESLVKKDYDAALSILDALNVATFKEAIAAGMGEQVALALEAFAE